MLSYKTIRLYFNNKYATRQIRNIITEEYDKYREEDTQ